MMLSSKRAICAPTGAFSQGHTLPSTQVFKHLSSEYVQISSSGLGRGQALPSRAYAHFSPEGCVAMTKKLNGGAHHVANIHWAQEVASLALQLLEP